MNLLDVRELSIDYGGGPVVDELSFSIHGTESVGLVGESGSGKTQTALAVLGLLPQSARVSGRILFDGHEITGAAEAELDRLRAVRMSIVFQDPAEALNPYLSIGEQMALVLSSHGVLRGKRAERRVLDMLERVGLPDPKRQRLAYPHQLSGGMRQRAMIAMALIADPDLLIADEPTTALDVTVQAQILELLETIRQDTALLLITHDLGIVAGNCDRMLVLKDGKLVESGETSAVFARPGHVHTEALLEAAARLRAGLAPVPGEPLLTASGTSVSYREAGGERLHAVKNVDMVLKRGETVAIVGESGSGKTSFARALMGLTGIDGGCIRLLGEPLAAEASARPIDARRALQLVFQDPQGSLNPQMRVADIVAEPLTVHEPGLSVASRRERATEGLGRVGLGPGFLDRYPHELSGGQAQRIAIARALIVEPKILVCDEALAAVDGTVRLQILSLLRDIQRRTGLSILFISHDLGVVSAISHRVMVMYLGQVVESGDGNRIFSTPRHPYTRALIDAVPVPDPERSEPRRPLRGEVPSILSPPPGCPFHTRCEYAETRCGTDVPAPTVVGTSTVACHRAEELAL